MATEAAIASFQCGQQVMSLNKDRGPQIGTVKFVGPVDGHQGTWVGVDWDNGEGRHNGFVNGVHYFDADGEQSGSFVRPQALTVGRTLYAAVIERYKGGTNGEGNDGTDGMYVLSVRQKQVAVQLVGKSKIEEKQKHVENLISASLVYEGISSAGEIQNVLPNLRELDLTGNLLSDWNAVSEICNKLPSLRVLNLSKNRLKATIDTLPEFSCIHTLVLNYCHLNWRQVEILKQSLAAVEEIHLCGNKITVLEVDAGDVASSSSLMTYVEGFKGLRLLNLEDNCIESWEEIMKLSQLESLEQLQVGQNNLSQIFYPANVDDAGDNACSFKPFQSLRCLLLGGNKIEDWASIDALNLFPNLREVRLSENPLTDLATGGAPRYILVARLAKIVVLNGSEIKLKERNDSEIRYVHHVMRIMLTGDVEEREKAHPRFLELKELHDVSEEQVQGRRIVGSEKMTTSLRAITLVCVAPSIGEKVPTIKKLPLSTTIGKLRLVCESIFKIKASKQRLFLQVQDAPIPTALDEDLDTLEDIGVGSEATILVDESSGRERKFTARNL